MKATEQYFPVVLFLVCYSRKCKEIHSLIFCLDALGSERVVHHPSLYQFSKDFQRFLKITQRLSEVHTNISNHFLFKFPKMSEDFRRLLIISEQSSEMF